MNYTIDEALNVETGEIVRAEQFFLKNEEDIFKERYRIEDKRISENKDVYICLYCRQPLVLRGTPAGVQTVHFRHAQYSKDCPIKTGIYTQDEIRCMKYNGAKESSLHKNMKKWVAESLKADPNFSSVETEKNMYNICDKTWRRPDIQAIYQKQPFVFEIQLSTTFLSVIAGRDAFYRNQKTFIVWIFNKFHDDLTKQKFTEKDILYANRNNIFIINEDTLQRSREAGELVLFCCALHKSDGTTKWEKEYVKFKDLNFDYNQYRVYWKNIVVKNTKKQIIKEKTRQLYAEQERWRWLEKLCAEQEIERARAKEANLV